MEKQVRVVVVDDNEAVLRSVREYFRNNTVINIVGTFNNGRDGLDYVLNYPNEYDLLIIDLILPHLDGIKVLEEMKSKKITKKIIVLSSFKDDFTIRKVQTLNADYFMLKPIDMEVIERRMLDLIEQKDELKLAKSGKIELEVSTLLHDLGIPSHVRGYRYIREGVLLLYANENVATLVTKELYPQIADKYQTTSSRVERAIRHAIEISWSRGDIKLMEEIFGNSIDFDRSRPTNSEFLTTIADRFKLDKKEIVV